MSASPNESTSLPDEAFAATDASLEPGTMVGEYQVAGLLGSGTFGDVYAGEQPLIGKKVAIKVLRQRFSFDPQMVSRFVAEARAVNHIRHRNIIDIFSFGLIDGRRHYFVMELLDGLTLGELLEKKGRIELSQAIPILRAIAAALDAAHEAGVTHRDLKPDNIFLAVEKDGGFFPKLLDFGVAKLVTEEMTHQTATGVAIGTPRYMSPEQCRGKKVDHRSDIYALGVVIHEMLTGKPIFSAESAFDMLFKQANEAPPRMSSVCPDLSPELDEPVLAMLAKRASARPNSAGEAVAALVERANAIGDAATLPPTPVAASASHSLLASAPTEAVAISSADNEASPSDDDLAHARTAAGLSPVSGTELSAALPAAPAATMMQAPSESAFAPIPDAPRPKVEERPVKPRAGRVWPIALAAGGVLALAITFLRSGEKPVPLPTTSPEVQPSTASAHEAPSRVTIRFTVTPPDADVLLNGLRVGSVSEPLVLPRSTDSHALRIEKAGYEAQTLLLVLDHDHDLPPIALAHTATAAPSASASAQRPATTTKAPRYHDDLERPTEYNRIKQ